MKARAESRNPGVRSSPGGAAADGAENLRTASCGILTGQERLLSNSSEPEHTASPPRSRKPAKAWIPALRARLPAKNGELRKGRRGDRKSVPPTTARAPAGMTVRLKIRGPVEPRKPKAGTPERNKTRLESYPPFRGIFITPVAASSVCTCHCLAYADIISPACDIDGSFYRE